jgi:hypothetical protein
VPAEWERSIGAAAAAAVMSAQARVRRAGRPAALDALLARLAAAGASPGRCARACWTSGGQRPGGAGRRDPRLPRPAGPGGCRRTNWRASWRTRSATWSTATALRGMARAAGLFVLSVRSAAAPTRWRWRRAVACPTPGFEREADASRGALLASGRHRDAWKAFASRAWSGGRRGRASAFGYSPPTRRTGPRRGAARGSRAPRRPAPALSPRNGRRSGACAGRDGRSQRAGPGKSGASSGGADITGARPLGTSQLAPGPKTRAEGPVLRPGLPVPAPGETRGEKPVLWATHRPGTGWTRSASSRTGSQWTAP